MKQYVDLDEVVSVCKENGLGQVFVFSRTIAEILEELEADYTPIDAYEIKEESE